MLARLLLSRRMNDFVAGLRVSSHFCSALSLHTIWLRIGRPLWKLVLVSRILNFSFSFGSLLHLSLRCRISLKLCSKSSSLYTHMRIPLQEIHSYPLKTPFSFQVDLKACIFNSHFFFKFCIQIFNVCLPSSECPHKLSTSEIISPLGDWWE